MSAATTAAVSAEKEWGQWTGSLEVLHMQDAGLCRETKHLWLLNVKVCHAFLQNLCYRSTKDLLVWSVCSNTTHVFQGLEDFFLAYDGAKKKKKCLHIFFPAFGFFLLHWREWRESVPGENRTRNYTHGSDSTAADKHTEPGALQRFYKTVTWVGLH